MVRKLWRELKNYNHPELHFRRITTQTRTCKKIESSFTTTGECATILAPPKNASKGIQSMRRMVQGRLYILLALLGTWMQIPLPLHSQADLKISGSSTIYPVVKKLVSLYDSKYTAKATVVAGGSGAGVKNIISGVSDIGMVSRDLYEDEKKYLKYTTFAYDAVVIIVNSRNPIESISLEQIRAIYTGAVTNWSAYCEYDKPIIAVNKELGRSTLELFEQYTGLSHPKQNTAGKAGKILSSVHEIGSNLEMATVIGGLPNAIGYLSFGTAKKLMEEGMPIKMLRLDGITPSVQKILSGEYPIKRALNLVYSSETPTIRNFLNICLSPEGLKVIESEGFIPVK